MPLPRRLKEWLFYGHIWIALGAVALGMTSVALSGTILNDQGSIALNLLLFLFFGTFGVYSLHRYLSFKKAARLPPSKRYGIVRRHPVISVGIGITALSIASFLIQPYLGIIWKPLAAAAFFTTFYLIPPVPGWRRLRDLPFAKGIWVALAWTLITHGLVDAVLGEPDNRIMQREYVVRFCFTLAVALLFDGRDVQLDRDQGVATFANTFPRQTRYAVYTLLMICAILSAYSFTINPWWFTLYNLYLPIIYLIALHPARKSFERSDEDYYAVTVNGLLLLPGAFPLFIWLITELFLQP